MKAIKKGIIFALCVASSTLSFAQEPKQGLTQWGVPTGQPPLPMGEYNELHNPKGRVEAMWKSVKKTEIGWGSTNIRYTKELPPAKAQLYEELELTAWKGERVNLQALIWTKKGAKEVSFSVSDLKRKKSIISNENISLKGFARYVMTDEFGKGCGYRPDITKYDSSLVADPIDHITQKLDMMPMTTQGLWAQIWVPEDAEAGTYSGTLTVTYNNRKIDKLPFKLTVQDRVLPRPEAWKYHLDFWQNPYAEARYAQADVWSKDHFDALRPNLVRLAQAGQKSITTTIMYEPWGGQTQDHYASMIAWTKLANGKWAFDFTAFDQWVEFAMSCGITKQINCYSMIPWNLSFRYFDQATSSMKEIKMKTGDEQYAQIWGQLLTEFAKHLKKKGWFEKTCISMDERPMEDMMKVFAIIKKADPNFKVSMAGNYHPEIEEQLNDYSIASRFLFPQKVLDRRKSEGKISTYYTCCTESYPNLFSFSSPAEAEWISWYAAHKGLDGYLRWDYNHYTVEPLLDSRFRAFPAGDCYIVYPNGRSSIRMEKMIEGIQQFEKIHILKTYFLSKGDASSLNQLNTILNLFDIPGIAKKGSQPTVEKAREGLNKLSETHEYEIKNKLN